MPDFGDGGAINQIGEKPVAVRGHGDQVATFGARDFEDFLRRIASGMMRARRHALAAHFRLDALQVLAVFFHLRRIGKVQVLLPLGRPARGDMK